MMKPSVVKAGASSTSTAARGWYGNYLDEDYYPNASDRVFNAIVLEGFEYILCL